MVRLKRAEGSKVPLLDYLRKRKSGDDEKPKDAAPELPKASIRQLWRYASGCDLAMVFLGSAVALITGAGMPAMSIVLGDISQSFIKANTLLYDPSYPVPGPNGSLVPFSDTYSTDDFRDEMIRNCVTYVIIGVIIFAAAFTQIMCFLVSGENMIHRMRKAFFKSILHQDITYFDKTSTGTLTTKMFDNLERVKEGTGDKVGLAMQFLSQFFSGFIIAFVYNWKLTLIMMSLTPILAICGMFMAKIMARAAAAEMKKYAKAGAVAEEALSSIRTVVAFNGQERECSRYDKALAAAKVDGIMKSIWLGAGLAVTFLTMFASYCLAFWLGTNWVADGSMSPNTILTAFFSVVMGSMALGQAGQQFAVIGTAQGAAAAILDLIDRVPEIDSYSTEGERPRDIKGHIVMKDVRFSYPTRPEIPILQGITLEALPGETVALVGASGCGKSTITQLLLRYYNPESGKILIDGREIASLNIEYLRKLIGVVSQEPILFNCTIEENILYGNPDVTPSQMTAACRMANAENFISQLPQGYKTIVGERGTQLSGGQKQRIAIARALVRDPKILLLDEATSALDAESESIVQAALDKAAQGRTTIVIAHRLSTIKNASKIIAIKDGEIAEVGTHEDLIAKQGLYYELVNAQVFTDLGETKGEYGRQTSVLSARSRRSSTSSHAGLKRTLSHETESSDSDESQPPAGQQEDIKSAKKRLKRDLEKEGGKAENLLTIVKHARSEWCFLIFAIVSSMIGGGVFPAFSQLFTEIIGVFSVTDKDKMRSEGHFWAMMFLVLGVIQGLALFIQCFLFGISSERFTMRLRSNLFRNIMRMDIAYFDMPNHSSGKITTRLATDTPNVRSALDYRLGSVFSCVVSVGSGLVLAFYYGWQLALLLIAIFPLLGVGHALQMKYMRGRLEKDKRETENAGKLALEAIESIRTVQALTLEKRFYGMFAEFLEEPHRTSTRKAIMQAVSYGFSTSIAFFLYASAFRFGLFLILDKILLPMNVLKVLFAISFTSGSLGFASAYFPEYSKARLAAGIIFKMLAEHPKIDSLMKGGKMKPIRGSVTLRDILFSYPERPSVKVLQGLDLSVEPGQTLALVGPSGCGKSTVVSLLERFYDPNGGSVLIDDDDLREYNVGHVRSHIALVSQEPILFDCSIRENITYGLDPATIPEESIEKATQLANIHKFIGELPDGLDTRVGEKGTQLSGGQKQRIAIARALIRNPKILLLDEATSALDTESEKVVQEALDRASQGRTCIVIAHRLSTIVNADLIAVVKNGVVIEKGTHSELIARRGAYFELTQKQSMKTS